MRIYIDESGNFAPSDHGGSRVCCEAALVVSDSCASQLLSDYVNLRATWTADPEVKGSRLSDEQVTAALTLLSGYDVLAQIVALDVGRLSPAQMKGFQERTGDSITAGLTPQHYDNARRWAHALRSDWLALSQQLAAQMYTLVLTVEEVIHDAPTYYAQRIPSELARFEWIIDPKDVKPTSFEVLWQKVVCPFLQTLSLKRSSPRVEGFDYSALDRFNMAIPDYLQPHVSDRSRGEGTALNLVLMMQELVSFPDSKQEPGLQLADIVASAFTKAMNGKLPPTAWRLLGPLMVQKADAAPTARLVAFGDGPDIVVGSYHSYVLKALRSRSKRMLA